MVDVTVTGAVRPRQVLTRGGGRPGDTIFVSGAVGAAAAGLGWLRVHGRTGSELPGDAMLAECVRRHWRPERADASRRAARPDPGGDRVHGPERRARRRRAADCRRERHRRPHRRGGATDPPGRRGLVRGLGEDPVTASLSGGDDYELLFTTSTKARRAPRGTYAPPPAGWPLTKIGELTRDPALVVERDGRQTPLPVGFVHFGADVPADTAHRRRPNGADPRSHA